MADAHEEQQEAQLVRRIHRAVGGPSKLSTYDDPALVRHVVLLALAEEYPEDTERITRGDLTAFERRIVRTVTNRGAAVRSRMRQRRELARLREECRKKDEKIASLQLTIAALQQNQNTQNIQQRDQSNVNINIGISAANSPQDNNNNNSNNASGSASASASASTSYPTFHNSPIQHQHQNIPVPESVPEPISASLYNPHPSQFIPSSSSAQHQHHQFLPVQLHSPDPAVPMEYKYVPPAASSAAVPATIVQPSLILPPSSSQGSPSTRIPTPSAIPPYQSSDAPASGRIQKQQTQASASSSSNEASAVEQDNFGNFIDHLISKP